MRRSKGFTLAELLIGMAILGVIATFTIVKLIGSQQTSSYNAQAHEIAAMITSAYQKAQNDGIITSSTTPAALRPYINYLTYDTSGLVINTLTCNNSSPCIWLHNGGLLWFSNYNFAGTSNLNAIEFHFIPNARSSPPPSGVQFDLYFNGFITTRGQVKVGTTSSCCSYGPLPAADPSWFSW